MCEREEGDPVLRRQWAPTAELIAMSYCPDSHNALFPAPPTSLGVMPGKVQMPLEILCLSPTLTITPRTKGASGSL